jgi:hypothetical protein
MREPRLYRFADANRPGLLLGLGARQAVPLIAGVLVLAVVLQTPIPPLIGLVGPLVGVVLGFGRWRGTPIAETLVPGARLYGRRTIGRGRWVSPSLVGDNTQQPLPHVLDGLRLLEPTGHRTGVIWDRAAGTVTAVLQVRGYGFPLAGPVEQDGMLGAWGAALSPLAREQSPVRHVTWQEWSHPVTSDTHQAFLDSVGINQRRSDPTVADYLALIDEQAPATIAHEILIAVTVDLRRVRTRRTTGSRLDATIDAVLDETSQLADRLEAAGLDIDSPMTPVELSSAIRVRSAPDRAPQVLALARSLAAATGRGSLEWGPMVVEADWRHVHVDSAFHRSYRVAGWPQLPVPADWLSRLLADTHCIRTVTVVMEPVPMGRAARAADREVMAREADSDLKERKGFRVNARERKRLADAERREHELSEGHAEFRFVGLINVTASTLEDLDDDCAVIEQAAAQCLLDLRPLDTRHDHGWVASLPVGRALAPGLTS